ncbi:hypothetical protein ACSS6W_001167 [Trichoderma asperelloides]|uniref:Uncharacterized protein n=1 Tax=Trichoderma asperellum TaxID=101201 RepID=A0A6V8QMI9_TRIAP|nr:hypothetical protein LI328DRAFT_160942 [Trichoderma asperelloides]GFP53605.1 hypothetical protein TASIC1_0002079000 [Trichoderma asperellum]
MFSNLSAADEDGDCAKDTTFYSCDANHFRGCCSVDPCDLNSCPDSFGSFKDPKDGGKGDGDSKSAVSVLDEATPSPTPTTSSRPAATSKESAAMTDSGITHTIPNNSIVTITRHTTIITGRPSVTTSSNIDPMSTTSDTPITESALSTSDGASLPSSTDAGSVATPSASSTASPLPPGAIVGIAVGAVALIAIIVVIVLTLVRRKKQRRSEADFDLQDNGRDDVVEEKHFPHPVSAHTTGTQGSSDPFAPFGGRADQPEDPYRPASGAFEMDGSSAAPIELPAVSVSGPSTNTHKSSRLEPVQEITTTDPRANLTSVPGDDGKPAYVNHWDQYKNLG